MPVPRRVRRQNETVAAVIQLLQERWPACFAVLETRRRPLKIGIHNEILEALDGAITQAELRRALGCYTANSVYLQHMTAGATRVDLDGRQAGRVTREEAEYAVTALRFARSNEVYARTAAKQRGKRTF
jgi:ProP effector